MVDFEEYKRIGNLINSGNMAEARSAVIKLLDSRKKNNLPKNEILNHLIREVGLYPYLTPETADWKDTFAVNMFKANVGEKEDSTLHLEQAYILRRLLQGESLAVSAPTSFGKSYIIDAYIAIKKPDCVVIIVPTVALANETRRRLARKFASQYSIITTTDEVLTGKDIFVFPQERAFSYFEVLKSIDILIVDEFYKAGLKDDERAERLLSVMIELGKKAKQRYFLGPNIDSIAPNPITNDMELVNELDFKTVVTYRKKIYEHYPKNQEISKSKADALVKLLSEDLRKTIVYVGRHAQVSIVSEILIGRMRKIENSQLCNEFSKWLEVNYGSNCTLVPLIQRGVGVHNGNLHRSLAQIQIKLFEEESGLNSIISTSSIIEGVNTQAENVVLWENRIGKHPLDSFTYKNIIGRAGRMFKYFIGYVYLLEEAPQIEKKQIELPLTDDVICGLDQDNPGIMLNLNQKNKLKKFNSELANILGKTAFESLRREPAIKGASPTLVLRLAKIIKENQLWPQGYRYLTQDNSYNWRDSILEIFTISDGEKMAKRLRLGLWGCSYNWSHSVPSILNKLQRYNITENDIFSIERDVTFKVPSVLSIVSILKRVIHGDMTDIKPLIQRASNAFLPKNVFELEEYGLPRMISKKIHRSHLIDLEDESVPISQVIQGFKQIGYDNLIERLRPVLSDFDIYIIRYFYAGI